MSRNRKEERILSQHEKEFNRLMNRKYQTEYEEKFPDGETILHNPIVPPTYPVVFIPVGEKPDPYAINIMEKPYAKHIYKNKETNMITVDVYWISPLLKRNLLLSYSYSSAKKDVSPFEFTRNEIEIGCNSSNTQVFY